MVSITVSSFASFDLDDDKLLKDILGFAVNKALEKLKLSEANVLKFKTECSYL